MWYHTPLPGKTFITVDTYSGPMVSRENRVLLASTGAVLLVLVAVAVTDVGGESAALAALVFAGLGVLAPQLYLAATDDAVNPRIRVRVGVGVTLFLLWGTWSAADPASRTAIGGASAVLALSLLGYEFWAGYRSTAG